MSFGKTIILNSFWLDSNEKPHGLQEQVQYYQDYWKKVEQEKDRSE